VRGSGWPKRAVKAPRVSTKKKQKERAGSERCRRRKALKKKKALKKMKSNEEGTRKVPV
jgi:hypothetical protein